MAWISPLATMLVGLIYSIGAASLVYDPNVAIGTVVEVVGGGPVLHWLTAGSVAVLAGAQAWVGLEFVLGDPGRGIRIAAAWLTAFLTAWLVVRGLVSGWSARCGCVEILLDQSIPGGLARNSGLLACLYVARRPLRGESGGGTR